MNLTFHVPPLTAAQGVHARDYVILIVYSSEKYQKLIIGLIPPCQDFPNFLILIRTNTNPPKFREPEHSIISVR